MFKFLVVASLVLLAVAQAPSTPAPTAPTASGPVAPTTPPLFSFQPATAQSYVVATESITGNTNCTTGTYYQNVFGATLSFADPYPAVAYKTGVCTNTSTSQYSQSSIAFSYTAGVLQSWTFATPNCTGSYTVANITKSCSDTSSTYGFPSSTQTVAIPYSGTTFPSLPGYLAVTLNNGVPTYGTFSAVGVCLRVPNPTGKSYNSTKVACNGASSAASTSVFSDNACQTAYVAPPSTPIAPVPTAPVAPSPYTYFYACTNSAAPVAPTPTPTSSTPSGSTPGAPKAPGSSAAHVVLSAAAAVAAGAALLF